MSVWDKKREERKREYDNIHTHILTLTHSPRCPECGSSRVVKNGHRYPMNGVDIQRYICKNIACRHRFSESLNPNRVHGVHNQVCVTIRGAKNLDAQARIKTVCAGDSDLINYAWLQKKRGNSDATINLRVSVLRRIIKKGGVLSNPDTVTSILAVEPLTKAQKYQWCACYRSYTKTMKIPWDPPRVRYQPKEPFMPTYEELSALIHAASKTTATFLQVALTTGARVGEICKLKWTDINTENLTISINNAEKGSRNRTIKVPTKTIAMINALSKKHDPYLFNQHTNAIRANFCNLRRKLANTQKNPRFKQIHLHTFRHFFATEKLRQTKMLKYVQYLLGHKSIMNTERYTHMIDYGNDKYYSAVAKTVDEVRKLAEDGWTYFQEVDGEKVFRKPR